MTDPDSVSDLLDRLADRTEVGSVPLPRITAGARRGRQRRQRIVLGAVAAGVALTLGGVTAVAGWSDRNEATDAAAPLVAGPETVAGEWEVVEIDSRLPWEETNNLLTFTPDEVSGTVGCNLTSADIVWGADGAIEIGPVFSTRTACIGPDGPAPVIALSSVVRAHLVDADTLELRDADGSTLAVLRRTAPPTPLPDGVVPATSTSAAGSWTVEEVHDERARQEAGGAHLDLEGATMRGFDSCNSIGSTLTWGEHGALRFGSLATTLAGCSGRLGSSLDLVRSAALTADGRLVLQDAEGATVVVLRRAPFPDGTWAVADDVATELVVADGAVRSVHGCDGLVGSYTAEPDGAFTFEPGMARGGACDASGDLVDEFLAATRWTGSSSSGLRLLDADGLLLLALVAVE
ncbi:MAG TPA: META domain-containing protein [Nocardioides sp.]